MKVERSRHLVLVTPPDVGQAGAVWDHVFPAQRAEAGGAGACVLIVTADRDSAAEWAAAAPTGLRAHAVTSLERSAALLRRGPPPLLAGAPADLAALLARSALQPDTVQSVIVAWPEGLPAEAMAALETVLGELPEAPRVVLSWNPPALSDFLERYARRAEVVGAIPLDEDARPLAPVASARFAVVAPGRRRLAVAAWRDATDPGHPCVWQGGPTEPLPECDGILCTLIPTRSELQALAAKAPVTIFATALQLPYLRGIATLTPLSLAGAADRAQDRAAALRAEVAALLEGGNVDAELTLLAPLFERFEPAEVAAALLRLARSAVKEAAVGEAAVSKAAVVRPAAMTKVFFNVGKKDKAGPKDLVGALIREVGVERAALGKIDVKETFSIVEIAAGEAERVVQRLLGMTLVIRGRRVQARLDRER